MMTVKDFLKETVVIKDFGFYKFQEVRPRVVCADGFSISIQASENHYCSPRENGYADYTEVELGFPSELVPELEGYEEEPDTTQTVFPYVPIGIVEGAYCKAWWHFINRKEITK